MCNLNGGLLEKGEFSYASVKVGVGAWMGMFVGPGPMIAATTSLFMVPLAKEFGWSRTLISAVALISPLTVAVCSSFAGRAIDRWGVRNVVLPVIALFGLLELAISQAGAGWQLLVLYMLLGICASVHNTPAYTKVVSLWFGRSRGLVIGLIIALGNNGGAALSPQLVRYCIQHHGWRSAYFVLGVIVLCVGLPVVFALLREPARVAPAKSAAPSQPVVHSGLTPAEALRTRAFWQMIVIIFLAPMCVYATVAHSVPMLTERGLTMELAASALSLLYLGGVIGDLTAGILMDRVHTPRIVLPFFVCALIGVSTVHHVSTALPVLAGAMVLGICQGSEMGITAYLTSRFFGMRSYGTLYGMFFAAANLGIATGIISMGRVHTVTGSYKAMTPVVEGAMILVVLLVSLLPAYVFSARTETEPAADQQTAAAR
jgi:MFS family permease